MSRLCFLESIFLFPSFSVFSGSYYSLCLIYIFFKSVNFNNIQNPFLMSIFSCPFSSISQSLHFSVFLLGLVVNLLYIAFDVWVKLLVSDVSHNTSNFLLWCLPQIVFFSFWIFYFYYCFPLWNSGYTVFIPMKSVYGFVSCFLIHVWFHICNVIPCNHVYGEFRIPSPS